MSAALEGLYAELAPLRIYKLRTGSLIDQELAVYGAAFAMVEQRLEEIRRASGVQTADGEALALHEALVGLTPRDGLDIETRRSLVLYRLGAAPLDFTCEGIRNAIRAAGMEAKLTEDPGGEALVVHCVRVLDASLDLDGMKRAVRAVLPAHLEVEFDMGELTWDMFDGGGIDWDRWDAADMTWGDFDLNGHSLLGLA